jgi:hypothetical protein
LIEREDDGDDAYCQECRRAIAVGPCAACEAMICADCGVMSRDPGGQRVICTSCAGIVAHVADRRLARRPRSVVGIAVALLAVIAVGIAAALLR